MKIPIHQIMRSVWFPWHAVYDRLPGKISSYAQHGEDLALARLLGTVQSFVDVGASDGRTCSNTLYFALRGARGLLFEPTEEAFASLRGRYALCRRCICVNEGLSNRHDHLQFREAGLLSFAIETEDKAHTEQDRGFLIPEESVELSLVTVRPLGHWLQKYDQFRHTCFMSLDVEGHELAVLQGIDFSSFQTRCFVIETHGESAGTRWLHRDYAAIRSLLGNNGYDFGLRSPLNTFWFHRSVIGNIALEEVATTFAGYSRTEPAADGK